VRARENPVSNTTELCTIRIFHPIPVIPAVVVDGVLLLQLMVAQPVVQARHLCGTILRFDTDKHLLETAVVVQPMEPELFERVVKVVVGTGKVFRRRQQAWQN